MIKVELPSMIFKHDLKWFNTFLPVYNCVTFFQYIPTTNVYLNACTTALVAIYETQVYALSLPKRLTYF